MHATIRPYDPQDEAAVVTLSLRAWAPVFASLESELGRDLFLRLHGDWREYQAGAVATRWPPTACGHGWPAALSAWWALPPRPCTSSASWARS